MARALKKCHSDLCHSDIYVHCMDTIQETNANKTTGSGARSHLISAVTNSTNKENGRGFDGKDALKRNKSQSIPFETKHQTVGLENESNGILISNDEYRKMRAISIGNLSLGERNLERIRPESGTTHSDPDYLEYKQNIYNRSCMSHSLIKRESPSPFFFGKNSFPQYLNHLLEHHPDAYAIDLLRHRMGGDVEDADEDGEGDSNASNSDDNNSCNEKANNVSTKLYEVNPLFKRVIIIDPPPKVSYHPKKKFSAASKLSWKDRKMLMRTTTWNKRFYSSGNIIGTIHVQLRFLVISQFLRINAQIIEFYTDYRSDGARLYIQTAIETGEVKLVHHTSKDMQLGQETLRVEFEEKVDVTNVDYQSKIKFLVFTYKKGIPKSHRCLAEAEFNLINIKSNTDRYQIELVRP